jgi:UDP-N-acetylmuramoyl-tripeptide--D-alanyl-D-alanine ligase
MLKILQNILAFFAKRIIKRYHPKVIGITGSVGKTSAKEAIALVLSTNYRVRASYKNYNNEIGLPLTIIGIKKSPGKSILKWLWVLGKAKWLTFGFKINYPEILVLEMAADKPGDIDYLLKIAPCDVGVLTNISRSHVANYKNMDELIKEKKKIITGLKDSGTAVLNGDNELIMKNMQTRATVMTYGVGEGMVLQANNISLSIKEEADLTGGINFKVDLMGSTVPVFLKNVLAPHLVSAALAGLAVGHLFEINLVEAASALRDFNSPPGRMRIVYGIKNTLLIDDTYNANPESTLAALKTVSEIKLTGSGKRYAILGDMLELGQETDNAHREVGMKVAELNFNYLLTVGEASKNFMAKAAVEAGMDKDCVISFDNSISAGKFLQNKMEENDLILIKGSQGMRMEKITKEVMADPLRAKELLVRQEGKWV